MKPPRLRTLLLALSLGLGVRPGSATAGELISSFVLLGPGGAASARAVIAGAHCPRLRLARRSIAMTRRVAAAPAPARAHPADPGRPKVWEFPVTVCEAALPRGAGRASIEGRPLPAPAAQLRRLVVIGDTGCRVKTNAKGVSVVQACHDASRYPFARIAAAAARWKPDLVVHVGDYLYRESPCPEATAGCQGDPSGYGWDAWRADFFDPADPLLRVAPLALARGNHETCDRAGQGWRRLLGVGAWNADTACDDPAKDLIGDHSAPYAIPLGPATQLIMLDSSAAPAKALDADDARAQAFDADFDTIERLSAKRRHNILVDHHPILGFAARAAADGAARLDPGNLALQSVFARKSTRLFPASVDLLLSGHVHVWEQLSFDARFPSQFVTGFSGTEEDIVPLPAILAPDAVPAPDARVEHFASWVDGFGFMTMERVGDDRWRIQVRDVEGRVVDRCRAVGRRSWCRKSQIRLGGDLAPASGDDLRRSR